MIIRPDLVLSRTSQQTNSRWSLVHIIQRSARKESALAESINREKKHDTWN